MQSRRIQWNEFTNGLQSRSPRTTIQNFWLCDLSETFTIIFQSFVHSRVHFGQKCLMGGEALRRRNRSSRSSFPAEQSAKKKARETRKDEREVHPNCRFSLPPPRLNSSVRPLWKRSSACQEEYSAGRAIIGETNANKRDRSHCLGPSGHLLQPGSRRNCGSSPLRTKSRGERRAFL